ncbi:MAG: shikimate kinase [Saprospiraceae bacterium]
MKTTRLFLLGFMGSGKSYWGRRLAGLLHLPCYDLDAYIAENEQKEITALFLEQGEAHFRALERRYLQALIALEPAVIATGGGTPCFFDNMDIMLSAGCCVYLEEPEDILFQRLAPELAERPLIRHLDRESLPPFIREKLAERLPYYLASQIVVHSPRSLEDIWEKLRPLMH